MRNHKVTAAVVGIAVLGGAVAGGVLVGNGALEPSTPASLLQQVAPGCHVVNETPDTPGVVAEATCGELHASLLASGVTIQSWEVSADASCNSVLVVGPGWVLDGPLNTEEAQFVANKTGGSVQLVNCDGLGSGSYGG